MPTLTAPDSGGAQPVFAETYESFKRQALDSIYATGGFVADPRCRMFADRFERELAAVKITRG